MQSGEVMYVWRGRGLQWKQSCCNEDKVSGGGSNVALLSSLTRVLVMGNGFLLCVHVEGQRSGGWLGSIFLNLANFC